MRLTQTSKLRTTPAIPAILAVLAIVAVSPLHGIETELPNGVDSPGPEIATPNETRAILGVVVEHMKFEGVPLPPPRPGEPPRPEPKRILVVVDQSLCFGDAPRPDCSSESAKDLLRRELDSVAPRTFRAELVAANQEPRSLDLEGIPRTKVAHSSEIAQIFAKGWWTGFYKQFPDSSGFARVSQPVLTKDRKQALIFVAHHCGGLCGTGTILLLNHSGTHWKVIRQKMLWIS